MTFRAIILGLLGAFFIGTFGYILPLFKIPPLTRGHMPVSIFGALFILMAVINPLLYRLKVAWRFAPAEIAVALALVLTACNIAHSGFLRYFSTVLIMPIQHNETAVGWKKNDIMSYCPPELLVNDGRYDMELVGNYMSGIGTPGHPIGISEVPWGPWRTPLAIWLPLVLLFAAAVIAMCLVVHHQWANRERLRYPIADFASTLVEQQPGSAMGAIFHNKLFWLGLCIFLGVRVFNLLYKWLPDYVPFELPYSLRLDALIRKFPEWAATEGAKPIIEPRLYPVAMAFTFFLASDIGLSLGLGPWISMALTSLLTWTGVEISGGYIAGGLTQWLTYGAFLGYALMLLYIGRRYYWKTAYQALTFRPQGDTTSDAAWAMRMFFLTAACLVLILSAVGLDWTLAIMLVATLLLMAVVLARINAEAGVFFFKPNWAEPCFFTGLFGLALGPKAIIIISMVYLVLSAEPFEALAPYVVNGLKIADRAGAKPSKVSSAAAIVFALTLALAVPVGLWADYNFGKKGAVSGAASLGDLKPSRYPFEEASKAVTKLKATDQLQAVTSYSPLGRLLHMQPERRFLWSAGIGIACVLLLGGLRLRLPWWPLHPVVLLGLCSWPLQGFGVSFMLGWLIKTAVTKLGGAKAYQAGKILMIGIIAGDILGGLSSMVIDFIYFAVTGLQPYRPLGGPPTLW